MMAKSERHARLLEVLAGTDRASIADLADAVGMSEVTVRRDVAELASRGWVERQHGSVRRAASRAQDRPHHVRESAAGKAKDAMARVAAKLVRDGDAIALDVGTSVLRMVPHLMSRANLTIVTTNLRTAWRIASNPDPAVGPPRLIVAGGMIRTDELSLGGTETIAQLRRMRVDVAFIGVAGVTGEGFSDFDLEDAQLKRVMIQTARRRVVLADHTKFNEQRFAHVADPSEIDVLVTDQETDRSVLSALREAGVDVIVAE